MRFRFSFLFHFTLAIPLFLGTGTIVSAEDSLVPDAPVPFSFDNREVNVALIALYEENPAIWKPDQLFLIGSCYIAEGRFDEAQAFFEKLHEQIPSNIRLLKTLGAIHATKGEYDKAMALYQQAWRDGQDLDSLRQLGLLKLQSKDLKGFEGLFGDLFAHQTEDEEIQKMLLSYSLTVDDKKRGRGRRVFEEVVRHLNRNTFDINDELGQLLLKAFHRYHPDAGAGATAFGDTTPAALPSANTTDPAELPCGLPDLSLPTNP